MSQDQTRGAGPRARYVLVAPGVRRVLPHHPTYGLYAGFVSRAMAMLLDLLLLGAVLLAVGAGLDFFGRTSGLGHLVGALAGRVPAVLPISAFFLSAAFEVAATLFLAFCYFTFFHGFGGATLGKYLLGLRVVTRDGRPLRPVQAALRSVAYAASALPLYLGFLAVLVSDRRRGWHDRLAGTAVVHSWPARPDETFLRAAIRRLDGGARQPD